MPWIIPRYGKTRVDAAGRALIDENIDIDVLEPDFDVLSNWRAAHSFPLNTFRMRMRLSACQIYPSALIAQRLKRVNSILYKLQRFPQMRLSQMQDIGGCRAVLRTPAEVRRLTRDYKTSRIKHKLVREDDYITTPKNSGYRGIHLVYRYMSDRSSHYNGLLIELQIRSRIQHAWATAVETVGTFIQHSLKSSEGPDEWLRFFELSGSVFARVESTPLVPGTPTTKKELQRTVRKRFRDLDVAAKLSAYGEALTIAQTVAPARARYFLLSLLPVEGRLSVGSYAAGQLKEATDAYLGLEKHNRNIRGAETVLVSADSLDALRRAYPNYFLDTQVFIRELEKAT